MKYYQDKKLIAAFGKRLQELRKSKSLTQEGLAALTGFEASYLGKIERGVINTSLSHIGAIAKALEVEPEDLFKFKQTLK